MWSVTGVSCCPAIFYKISLLPHNCIGRPVRNVTFYQLFFAFFLFHILFLHPFILVKKQFYQPYSFSFYFNPTPSLSLSLSLPLYSVTMNLSEGQREQKSERKKWKVREKEMESEREIRGQMEWMQRINSPM